MKPACQRNVLCQKQQSPPPKEFCLCLLGKVPFHDNNGEEMKSLTARFCPGRGSIFTKLSMCTKGPGKVVHEELSTKRFPTTSHKFLTNFQQHPRSLFVGMGGSARWIFLPTNPDEFPTKNPTVSAQGPQNSGDPKTPFFFVAKLPGLKGLSLAAPKRTISAKLLGLKGIPLAAPKRAHFC